MDKKILAEDFANASNAYSAFQGAMMEMFDGDPVMSCLIGNLNKLADEYYKVMVRIYAAGMTLDEVLKL